MSKQTIKLTSGAMLTAIFGALMLLNRQTGNLFEDFFVFLYPIPLVAFSAQYGVRSGVPVLIAMALMSVLFGNLTSIFYAVTQALIGLIFGGCLYHRTDMTKTLFIVMGLSAVVNLLNTFVLGFLFGVNLNDEIAEMQTMMNEIFIQAGVEAPESLLSADYLKQMIVISMTVFGLLQGFLVYEISLWILRRLQFPVQRPKSVFLYYPPKWTGYLAILAFFYYGIRLANPLANDTLQNALQTVGICGYIYLVCFGFIAILLFMKVRFPRARLLGGVIGVIGMFFFPWLEMMFGFVYIVSSFHARLLEGLPQ